MNKKVIIYVSTVVAIGLVVFIISHFFIQLATIKGSSMEPTYNDGDMVLIKKNYNSIKKGDIIIAKQNGVTIIKRVVGIENDELIIEDGKLYVNGKEVKRYQDIEVSGILENTVKLEKDEYFVMGDNYNNSIDSRSKEIGIIKKKSIIGVVI